MRNEEKAGEGVGGPRMRIPAAPAGAESDGAAGPRATLPQLRGSRVGLSVSCRQLLNDAPGSGALC